MGMTVPQLLASIDQASRDDRLWNPFSYMEQNVNIYVPDESEADMLVWDTTLLLGLAALISALASLIWSIRRKP